MAIESLDWTTAGNAPTWLRVFLYQAVADAPWSQDMIPPPSRMEVIQQPVAPVRRPPAWPRCESFFVCPPFTPPEIEPYPADWMVQASAPSPPQKPGPRSETFFGLPPELNDPIYVDWWYQPPPPPPRHRARRFPSSEEFSPFSALVVPVPEVAPGEEEVYPRISPEEDLIYRLARDQDAE